MACGNLQSGPGRISRRENNLSVYAQSQQMKSGSGQSAVRVRGYGHVGSIFHAKDDDLDSQDEDDDDEDSDDVDDMGGDIVE